MKDIYYRIAHKDTGQGVWYDWNGKFTGLIHDKLSFCSNNKLTMPYDNNIVGWISATRSLDDLFLWFTESDIKELEKHGWFITIYKSKKAKVYNNHFVICQVTSNIIGVLKIDSINKKQHEQNKD